LALIVALAFLCVVSFAQSVPVQLVDVKGGKVEPNEHDMKQVRANCCGA
jgi:hypothetical protein